MESELSFTGIDTLLANLELTEQGVTKGVNNALRMGAEVTAEYIEANTPVGAGDKRTGHARDNVTISGVRTEGGTAYKHILAGYNQNVYWYMWFLEKGTYSKGNPKGIAPTNHTEKAFKASHAQVESVIANQLEEVVRGLPFGR